MPEPVVQFPQRGPVGIPLHGLRRAIKGEPAVLSVLFGQRQLGVLDAGSERVLQDHQDIRAPRELAGDIDDRDRGTRVERDDPAIPGQARLLGGFAPGRLQRRLVRLSTTGDSLPMGGVGASEKAYSTSSALCR